VVGVVANVAIEQLLRYRSLGTETEKWALDLSCKDALTSFRTFKVFLEGHRLTYEHTNPSLVLSYWRLLWLAGLFIPLAKWATAEPLAKMAGVIDKVDNKQTIYRELPPRPDWLPGGVTAISSLFPWKTASAKVRASLNARLGERQKSGKATLRAKGLAWSFLGIKAMMPPMWAPKILDSLKDHASLLNSQPPPLPLLHWRILKVVAQTVVQLLKQQPGDTMETLPRPKLSSSSGWVREYDSLTKKFKTTQGTRAAQWNRLEGRESEELTSMHHIQHKTGRQKDKVLAIYQTPYQFDWSDWDYDPIASVIALQEPFKVRTITVSDGPATAAGSPFQQSWHTALKSLSPFELIGGRKVAECIERFDFDGTPFVSGDYSAATDRVNIEATKVVFDELTRHMALPAELRRRLRESLLDARVSYSDALAPFKNKIPIELYVQLIDSLPEGYRQKNGQLMGNILSFPILCIINLASWLVAHKDLITTNNTHLRTQAVLETGLRRGYFTRQEIDSFPVLINGDDILFKAEPELYSAWRSNLPHLGFKLSVGKNYYSDSFFTVNSELYGPEGRVTRPWWGGFLPDFVRMRNEIKWETGLDVLSADMRRVLTAVQQDLRLSVKPSDWPIFNKNWFHIIGASTLMTPYTGLNWFIPIQFGGMGLDSTGLPEGTTTYMQRKLAVRSMLDPEHAPAGYGAEGSLPSAENERKVRSTFNTEELFRKGTVLKHQGRTYVQNTDKDIRTRLQVNADGEVKFSINTGPFFNETIDSAVQASVITDKWLDHHLDGVRISTDTIKQRVRASLNWGLELSGRKCRDLFPTLVSVPLHRVLKKLVVIQEKSSQEQYYTR